MITVDGFFYTVSAQPCHEGAQSFIFRLEPEGVCSSATEYYCVVPKPYDVNQLPVSASAAVYDRITSLTKAARYPFLPYYLRLTKEQQRQIGKEKMAWVYDLLDEEDEKTALNGGWCQAFSDIRFVEVINGMTLATYLNDSTPSLEDRLLIFLKVYAAVECMHAQLSIVHGDLTLDNIMLRKDGSVVFIDFGKSECLSHQPLFRGNNNAARRKDAAGLFELFYELVTGESILAHLQGVSGANSADVMQQLLFDAEGHLRPLSEGRSSEQSLLAQLQPLYEALYQQSQHSGKISRLRPDRYLRHLFSVSPDWSQQEGLAVHLEKNIGYIALWAGQSTGFKTFVVAASIVALGLLTAQFWLSSTALLPLLIQMALPFLSQAGAILSVMIAAVVGLKLYYDGAYQQYLDQQQFNALSAQSHSL